MLLEPTYLDQIYTQWLIKDRQRLDSNFVPSHWDRRRNYQREYRSNFNNQRFEDWLYGQGFTVVQREGKRYLKFSGDDKRLTFFLLKYGITA